MQKSGSLPFWSGEGGRGQEEGNKVVQRTSHSKGSVLVDIHLCRDCFKSWPPDLQNKCYIALNFAHTVLDPL